MVPELWYLNLVPELWYLNLVPELWYLNYGLIIPNLIFSCFKIENLKIWKFGKDARRKMIDICLVKSASTSVVC